MIDATKSPTPAWRKYLTVLVLGVLLVIAGYFLWTKELHKSTSNGSNSSPTTATVPVKQPAAKSPATTVPGGIPISNRNPFAS
jgi:hypothetical protein